MRDKKMRRNFILSVIVVGFFGFWILPFASAEILFGQSNYLYNVGDYYLINLTFIPAIATNDFLTSSLVCPNGKVEIYRNFYSLKAVEQKNVELSIQFDNSLLGNLKGNCYLDVKYGNDAVRSREFIITTDVDVSLSIVGASYDPGDEIIVKGEARKKNGQSLEGFVEANIYGSNQSVFASSRSGNFNFSIPLSADVQAGNYELKVKVYEKNSLGGVTSEGYANAVIKINQIVEKMEIATKSQNVTPGDFFTYAVILYDQASLETQDDVRVIVYQPDGGVFSKKLARAGEIITTHFELNASPGYWLIEAGRGELSARRAFYIAEIENASMKIENQTLIITNVGNVPYIETLEIFVGDENELKEIKLNIGETKRYRISAKDGEYEIKISDGSYEKSLGKSYLTGSAVDIREEGSAIGGSTNLVFWIIILLILVVISFNLYRKVKKKNYLARIPSVFLKKEKTVSYENAARELTGSLISGKKEEVAVIVLKIKNLSELLTSENNALPAIERAIERAKYAKAKVYEQGEYKTIILSASMIGEEAVRKALFLAEEINSILEEYNKYYALKINYGIGVHCGEMILETNKEGKIRFTAVGSATVLPKRAADRANGNIYLSEIIHRKMLGKIKSEKISSEGFWKLNQIIRRDEHKDFINKFMKKQSDEKARKAGFVK